MKEEIDRFGSVIAFVIFYYFLYQFTIYNFNVILTENKKVLDTKIFTAAKILL